MMRNILRVSIVFTMICLLMLWSQMFVRAQQTSLPSIQLEAPPGQPHEIAWSPDGSMIAWAVGHNVWIYTSDLEEIMRLQGHTDEVLSLDWSPDGTQLVSGSDDATLRIWHLNMDLHTYTSQVLTGHEGAVFRVAWSPDGAKIASLGYEYTFEGDDYSLEFNETWVWDAITGHVLKKLPGYANTWTLDWSPDSHFIVNGGRGLGESTGVRIWDIHSGALNYEFFPGSINDVAQVDWDGSGRYLAITDQSSSITIFDLQVGDRALYLYESYYAVTVDWASDNTKIVTGDSNGHLIIWDISRGQPIIDLADGYLYGEIKWDLHGTKLASIESQTGALRIWDTSVLPNLDGFPTVTSLPIYPTATP
jgi:WD40 repeat protein